MFGQNVADYVGSSGATLERENIYRGGQLLATNETLTAGQPSSLTATPSSSNVALSWSGSASKYRIERKAAGTGYELLATTTSASTTDSGASTGNAYLYRVCSADTNNNCTSDYSNIALGAKLNFTTDATIVGYSEDSSNATTIKAAHITELRTAINAVRTLAGQSSASWTHSGLAAGDYIYADDVRDLRSALNYALGTLNIQTSNYTDNTIVSFADDPMNATTIKAVHIREVRQRSTSGAGDSTSGGSSGGLHYVLSDLQGSARAVMNNNSTSSAVIARHDYLPFGEEIGAIGGRTSGQGYTATDQNRWKYAMTERDATSGLDHTWFRKYENLSGRWTSPDPTGDSMTIGDPQSLNRYSYVQSDPVNLLDPDGLDPLNSAIVSARSLLANPVCRSLFGKTDPIALLNFMTGSKQNRIKVANGYPSSIMAVNGRMPLTPFKSGYAAASIDASARRKGPFANPYIFVNSAGFLNTGTGYESGYGLNGLSPGVAGGIAIIHELLHIADRIPSDGSSPTKSVLNTLLTRMFCDTIPNAPANTTVPGFNNTPLMRHPIDISAEGGVSSGDGFPLLQRWGTAGLDWLWWVYEQQKGRGELVGVREIGPA